jgi:hypothetical protein
MKIGKYLVIVIMMASISTYAQCKVKSPKLTGEYTGDCKKNLAHGTGVAKGADTFQGAFRKGFPHGEGVYTFENGDIFEGIFKKGKKEGKGQLKLKDSEEVIVGYWKGDSYIGLEKTPYKVLQKSAEVTTVFFKRKGERDELIIKFTQKGKTLNGKKAFVTPLEGIFGSMNATGLTTTVQNVTFPFSGTINGQMLKFRITQAGTWEITINLK